MQLTGYFEKTPKIPLIAAGLLLQAAAGTGSVYDMAHFNDWSHDIRNRVSYIMIPEETKPLSRPDVRTVAQHLENIRHIFGVPISHIADLLDVSRQAVYKWLKEDSTPEKEKQNIIIALSQVADKFQEANVTRADVLLKMKTFNGRSLLDIVFSGEDTSQFVVALIKEAHIMQASYEKSGLSSSKAQSTSDWQSYISIPSSSEKD